MMRQASEAVVPVRVSVNEHWPPVHRTPDDNRPRKSVQLRDVLKPPSVFPIRALRPRRPRFGAQGIITAPALALPYMNGFVDWQISGERIVDDHRHGSLRVVVGHNPRLVVQECHVNEATKRARNEWTTRIDPGDGTSEITRPNGRTRQTQPRNFAPRLGSLAHSCFPANVRGQ
jgi:hypothetical protein